MTLPILISLILLGLGGCNDNGSDDDNSEETVATGTFTDSPVAGLRFETQSQSGLTDTNGTFRYQEGENVTFYLGDLELGQSPGAEVLSPVDLSGSGSITDEKALNIAILLQTLDEDGDLNNGIRITAAVAERVSDWSDRLVMDQSTADFAAPEGPMQELLDALNDGATPVFTDTDTRPRTLRSATAAREHLERGLATHKVVDTDYGKLAGFETSDGEAWSWYGVPYARPPVGDLRWKPPAAPEPWQGVRQATSWGDQSAQAPYLQAFGKGGMSEDSLYLNITVPKGYEGEPLPVMVWFHGGGYAILTGNTPAYNHTALPQNGVIVVTVNHRLGAFGYLAHPALTAESGNGSSGNYAQLDMIAALTWIRDNIAGFGGDPENVTIFGQSGGGLKVISLLNSPLAEGLFHKAIVMTGMFPPSDTLRPMDNPLEAEEADGRALVEKLGLQEEEDIAAALRDVPWPDLAAAASTFGVDFFGPNIDGWYMLRDIREQGMHNDVPIMAGVTRGDAPAAVEGLNWYLPFLHDTNESDLYAYVYDHVPENWASQGIGAYHGIELVSVFGYPQSYLQHYLLGLVGFPDATPEGYAANPPGYGERDDVVAEQTMAHWAQFARTGNPSTEQHPWPAYTPDGEEFMLINYDMERRMGLSDLFGIDPLYP